jgi:hypothetical protein
VRAEMQAGAAGPGADNAHHGIFHFQDRQLFIYLASRDVASIICETLRSGHSGAEPGRPVQGQAVQVGPIKPTLKAPGTKRWKLKYGCTAFKLCFQFQVAPLHQGERGAG